MLASLRTCKPLRAGVRAAGRPQSVRVMAFQDQPKVQPNIKAGEKLPLDKTVTVLNKGSQQPDTLKLSDIFSGKKAVLFGLPGAYTSVCSGKQMPEYKSKAAELKQAGVDLIACTAVNDAYVMQAWAENLGVNTQDVMMLADGDASLHKELGLTQTLPGLGERSLRYSMFIDDGVVKVLNVEEPGGMNYKISGPSHMLEDLKLLQEKGQPIFHEASTFKK